MDDGKAEVRVIEVNDGRTQTGERRVQMQVKGGKLQWQDSGCMLAAVLERHGKNGNIGFGFVTGDCIKRGAAATTYFHDHHNLMVIGANPDDMLVAVRRILKRHYNPIMSLCTLGLPVSPALKLTDRGLVDVVKGKIVPLLTEPMCN